MKNKININLVKPITIISIFLLLLACGGNNVKDELDKTIQEMISLAEQEKGDQIFDIYLVGEDKRLIRLKLSGKNLERFKDTLLEVKKMEPEFIANDTVALFHHEEHDDVLKFVKIDDSWKMKVEL